MLAQRFLIWNANSYVTVTPASAAKVGDDGPSSRGRLEIARPTYGQAMKGLTECFAALFDGRSPYGKSGLRELSSQSTSPLRMSR